MDKMASATGVQVATNPARWKLQQGLGAKRQMWIDPMHYAGMMQQLKDNK